MEKSTVENFSERTAGINCRWEAVCDGKRESRSGAAAVKQSSRGRFSHVTAGSVLDIVPEAFKAGGEWTVNKGGTARITALFVL
nr:hypothetical protein FTX54_06980 [Alkalicoccus halolimnae]